MNTALTWRTVRPTFGERGSLEKLESAMVNGRRVWRKQLYTAPTELHGRVLVDERYWADGQPQAWYRSEEALMASLDEPVESNEP